MWSNSCPRSLVLQASRKLPLLAIIAAVRSAEQVYAKLCYQGFPIKLREWTNFCTSKVTIHNGARFPVEPPLIYELCDLHGRMGLWLCLAPDPRPALQQAACAGHCTLISPSLSMGCITSCLSLSSMPTCPVPSACHFIRGSLQKKPKLVTNPNIHLISG